MQKVSSIAIVAFLMTSILCTNVSHLFLHETKIVQDDPIRNLEIGLPVTSRQTMGLGCYSLKKYFIGIDFYGDFNVSGLNSPFFHLIKNKQNIIKTDMRETYLGWLENDFRALNNRVLQDIVRGATDKSGIPLLEKAGLRGNRNAGFNLEEYFEIRATRRTHSNFTKKCVQS